MAQKWNQDEHIREMATSLISPESFVWCSVRGTVNVAKKVMNLASHLMSLRLWSSARCGHPPESYSLLLSDDPEVKQDCGAFMECSHRWLLEFEETLVSEAAPHPRVKMLHREFCLILNHPTRLVVMDAFEIAGYNNNSEEAMPATKHLITILCQTLADNQTIEDIHGNMRKKPKATTMKSSHVRTFSPLFAIAAFCNNEELTIRLRFPTKHFEGMGKNNSERKMNVAEKNLCSSTECDAQTLASCDGEQNLAHIDRRDIGTRSSCVAMVFALWFKNFGILYFLCKMDTSAN